MDAFWPRVFEAIGETTGSPLDHPRTCSVGGGCINESFLIETDRGPAAFVKINAAEKLPMFEAEAEGLAELAGTGTIRVPRPFCFGKSEGNAFLALEPIAMNSRSDSVSQKKVGEQLAALHRVTSGSGRFGWHRDNTIGELPQQNRWTESWTGFFGTHRLGAQFGIAEETGRTFPRAGELLERLPELLHGHEPAPSLLHGDLWGGNASFDSGGEPVVFDPAVYYGDRETDLAFTEMFGGFGPAFYEAYRAAWPLDAGYENRKTLYNLYHVLNHYNHFGGGYAVQADSMIARLLSD